MDDYGPDGPTLEAVEARHVREPTKLSVITPAVVAGAKKAQSDAFVNRRSMDQAIRAHQRKQSAEDVEKAILEAVNSKALDDKSTEQLADAIVHRSAKIMLLGGKHFLPTSPREVTDLATAWARIAQQQTDRRLRQERADLEADKANQPPPAIETVEKPAEDDEVTALAKRLAAQVIASKRRVD